MAIWDDVVPVTDRDMYGKYTQVAHVGMGRKPAIVVVDMTELFIDERYSTGCGETARQAVTATGRLLEHARAHNVPRIFATWDPGHLPEEIGFWKCQRPQALAGARPEDLPDPLSLPKELGRRDDEPILLRGKPSAFFGTNFAGTLAFHGTTQLLSPAFRPAAACAQR